jgi:predicted nuclease of predicted toxin-antitoxin system
LNLARPRRAILGIAQAEGRVLLTLDKEFGDLAIVKGAPHAGIIGLVGTRARDQGPGAVHVLAAHAEDLAGRSVLTVEADRVRVRLPGP